MGSRYYHHTRILYRYLFISSAHRNSKDVGTHTKNNVVIVEPRAKVLAVKIEKNRTKITVYLQMTYSADVNTLSCVKVAGQCDTGSMTATAEAAAQKSIRLFTCDFNIYLFIR